MRRVAHAAVLMLATACSGGDDDKSVDTEPVIVDADDDGYDADEDCDDNDPTVHPFADEYCDGIDNDCDGTEDEDSALDAVTWYLDADGDGYGTDDDKDTACAAPEGYVAEGGDCDDEDEAYNPGAIEDDCTDPEDYDCDGEVAWADDDEDGWAACVDCDDEDPALNPDATEVCDDVDNDCDGDIDDDDDDLDRTTRRNFWPDDDGDGYGDDSINATVSCSAPSGYVEENSDCDDDDADVNPSEVEVCDADDVDEDCSGAADDDDPNVSGSSLEEFWPDADGDGYGDEDKVSTLACDAPSSLYVQTDSDCDDSNPNINPAASERCDALNTDEDCDGLADDDDSSVSTSGMDRWYVDDDEDGFGDEDDAGVRYCDDPSDSTTTYSDDNTDCDDGDSAINPDALEVCDDYDVDEDCSGLADDDDPNLDASGGTTWYLDNDGDGYGGEDNAVVACDDPSTSSVEYFTTGGDCDDDDADVSPDATEVCDAIDNDCDPSTTASNEVWLTLPNGTMTDVSTTFTSGTSSSPASVSLGMGTYTFCDGTFYVNLTSSNDVDLVGIDGVELNGANSGQPVLNASGSGKTVTVTDITLADGTSAYGGGMRASDITLELDGVTFDSNTASSTSGGGVYAIRTTVTGTDTVFVDNTATSKGGGFYSYQGWGPSPTRSSAGTPPRTVAVCSESTTRR